LTNKYSDACRRFRDFGRHRDRQGLTV